MYKNKFLEKINYSSNDSTSSFVFGMKDDKRNKRWRKERKKWGCWDERVGWNLNTFLLESLYTWLKIYYKRENKFINLECNKFNIDNIELTQKECIERMIDDLEYVLLNLDNDKEFETVKTKIKDCFRILGECFFAMWW